MLNSVVASELLPDKEALLVLIREQVDAHRAAQTLEARARIEDAVLARLTELLDAEVESVRVSPRDRPTLDHFEIRGDLLRDHTLLFEARLKALSRLYLHHLGSQVASMRELAAATLRVKQKQAVLNLWDRSQDRYVLLERFRNLDHLDSSRVEGGQAYVDTTQGVMTLPVRVQRDLSIHKLRVGGDSNGIPGIPGRLEYLVDGNPDTHFHYQRDDEGPLRLSIQVDLGSEQFLNALSLEATPLGEATSFLVEDVRFHVGSGTVSVSRLAPEESARMVRVSEGPYRLSFLPVRCRHLTLTLLQPSGYREAGRLRYRMGLKALAVHQIEYESQGQMASSSLALPEGLYGARADLKVFPGASSLYRLRFEAEADGEFRSLEEPLLLSGRAGALTWRAILSLEPEAFRQATSFVPEQTRKETRSLIRSVSRDFGPARIALPERPLEGEIFVLETRVARRDSDLSRGVRLGIGTGAETSFEVPFPMLEAGIEPDAVRVYCNRIPWTRVESEAELGSQTWCFSQDYKSVVLGNDTPDKAQVTMLLDEERMLLEERSDGYYHRTATLFDPETATVTHLPGTGIPKSLVLPRGQTRIWLSHRYLDPDSFRVRSEAGASYHAKDSRDLLAVPGDYYLDAENGLLFLHSAVDVDQVRVSFSHRSPQELPKEAVRGVYEAAQPVGIRISKTALTLEEVGEEIGGSLLSRINVLTGAKAARTGALSALNAKTLSHDYLVRGSVSVSRDLFGDIEVVPVEVEFQDGLSEFQGLLQMEADPTTAIQAGSTGIVQFPLAVGGGYDSRFGLLASDEDVFATPVESFGDLNVPGEYHVEPATGLVSVYVGAGEELASGIRLTYSYRDPDFDATHLYSVDYRRGILYASQDMNPEATIRYKTAPYRAAYDLALPIEHHYSTRDNSIEIPTAPLRRPTTLVKVLWGKGPEGEGLEQYRAYFTPFVSQVGLRFQ